MKAHHVSAPKIFNDPVYGFITVHDPLIQQLIDHPDFQRLGRISQVGLSALVYPGSQHTRFHHALGAMYLMQQAIHVLRMKGTDISAEEERGALIAILLHDIGHGPYSHTLEGTIVTGTHHEDISLALMQRLNQEFHLALDTAISIFQGKYPRKFFHQLVSGQLDVDRLDYLMRDSFYTGVAEGVIGSERIIKMMHVVHDALVIEEKGIYSIEKFIIARRLMYWQVYLHKTVLGAEALLTAVMDRARHLAKKGEDLFGTPAFKHFLFHEGPMETAVLLDAFRKLDDHDVMASIKVWAEGKDGILADLCLRVIHRRLFKVKLQADGFSKEAIQACTTAVAETMGLGLSEAAYYVRHGQVSNQAYDVEKGEIQFLMKNGALLNFFEASPNLGSENLVKPVIKHYLCFPKEALKHPMAAHF